MVCVPSLPLSAPDAAFWNTNHTEFREPKTRQRSLRLTEGVLGRICTHLENAAIERFILAKSASASRCCTKYEPEPNNVDDFTPNNSESDRPSPELDHIASYVEKHDARMGHPAFSSKTCFRCRHKRCSCGGARCHSP